MARDRIAEIAAVRSRKGDSIARYCAELAVRECLMKLGERSFTHPEFVPVKLVTSLEVFVRECVAELIDSGAPFTDRARGLIKDLKFDFDLTQALLGKRVTFGELVSHAVSVNNISDIDAIFSKLTEHDLISLLTDVQDRWAVEVEGKNAKPIVDDVASCKAHIGKLFEVRHVIVHEMPSSAPFEYNDLKMYAGATADFMLAVDQVIATLLRGDYPQTQHEMIEAAFASATEAAGELDALLEELGLSDEDGGFGRNQEAWETYRESEATFLSGRDQPHSGSIAPLLYWSAWESLTRARITWIRSHSGEGGGY